VEVDELEAEVEPAPDTLDGVIIIVDSINSIPSKFDDAPFVTCEKHRVPVEDTILSIHHDQAHHLSKGYIAYSRYICTAGNVPLFNQFAS